MDRKLLDQLNDGDAVAVALRGGAGWLNGTIEWRREDVLLLKLTGDTLPRETPFALVFLGDVSALGVPRALEPSTPETRQAGFSIAGP